MMTEAATISLRDARSFDEAVVVVRYDESRVALCLSLRSGADVELVMRKADANTLIDVLRKATER
jgi:hypothetical protein